MTNGTLFLIVVLLLLGGLLIFSVLQMGILRNPQPRTSSISGQQESLDLEADGTATVTGIVLENNQGCIRDLACYLRLQIDAHEIRVIYNPGEGESCFNIKAARQGFEVKKGQKIKAHGAYEKVGDLQVISTCTSEAFYISPVPE